MKNNQATRKSSKPANIFSPKNYILMLRQWTKSKPSESLNLLSLKTIFSCEEQLKKWRCHSIRSFVTFFFLNLNILCCFEYESVPIILKSVFELLKCLEGVWKVSERCLEGVWKVSGSCLEGVWKMPGGQKKIWVKIFWGSTFFGESTFFGGQI